MIWLIPIIGIVALIVAGGLAMWVTKRDEGTEKMRENAAAIHEGAQAFLMADMPPERSVFLLRKVRATTEPIL